MPGKDEKFDVKGFALALRDDIQQNRIKLPTLPTLSLEALLVVNDAGSSMADMARIISKDTSMAARLVRYANSPLYRGISNVSSVRAAITRIGIDAVRHAILNLAMKDVFTTAYPAIQSRMEALWQHSVEVASVSALLSRHLSHLNSEEAMLAGLIHDVGSIPILIKAKDYPQLLEDEQKLDKLLKVLHMSVGKYILSHWNFDAAMIDVAGNHDRLDWESADGRPDYVDVVMVANIICHEAEGRQYDRQRIPAITRIGVDLIGQVQEEIAEGAVQELGSMLH